MQSTGYLPNPLQTEASFEGGDSLSQENTQTQVLTKTTETAASTTSIDTKITDLINKIIADPATEAKQDTSITQETAINTVLGAIADAAVDTNAAGSASAKLRGLVKILANVITGTNQFAVKNSDGTNVGAVIATTVTGSASGAGQFAVTALDVTPYKKISVQTDGTYNLTQAFECSNNNVNWVACPMQNVAFVPLAENTSVTGGSTGLYETSVRFKYFRNRVSAYTSGTINTTMVLTTLDSAPATQPVWAGQEGVWAVNISNNVPFGATSITNSSGNVANASAVATLAGAVAKTTYITGFQITAGGATAGSLVTVTVGGVISGTMSYTFAVPAGATLGATPLIVTFPTPIAASAQNTAIVVTCPALGAGNTNAVATAQGYQQ